jgi:galactokinase
VVLYSHHLQERTAFSLETIEHDQDHPWSDYIRGVALHLQEEGYTLPGMEAYIHSNVPLGAGLASSAALEVATARAFRALGDLPLDDVRLALLCQRAENQFVGVNSGIMDQFVASLGSKGQTLFLDCRSLDYRLIPLPTDEVQIVVCDSRIQRRLVVSEYNQRRAECAEGVRILGQFLPGTRALRDVPVKAFQKYQASLPPLIARRCQHVIYENQRTLAAVRLLEKGELARLGELMAASHISLRDNYEVSSRGLDLLVELANQVQGVLGARLTGAGLGGCTVNLVQREAVEELTERVTQGYEAEMGWKPVVYADAVGGT